MIACLCNAACDREQLASDGLLGRACVFARGHWPAAADHRGPAGRKGATATGVQGDSSHTGAWAVEQAVFAMHANVLCAVFADLSRFSFFVELTRLVWFG